MVFTKYSINISKNAEFRQKRIPCASGGSDESIKRNSFGMNPSTGSMRCGVYSDVMEGRTKKAVLYSPPHRHLRDGRGTIKNRFDC